MGKVNSGDVLKQVGRYRGICGREMSVETLQTARGTVVVVEVNIPGERPRAICLEEKAGAQFLKDMTEESWLT